MKKTILLITISFLCINSFSQINFIRDQKKIGATMSCFKANAIGDINNDGLNDVIVGSYNFSSPVYQSLSIYYQQKDGKLSDQQQIILKSSGDIIDIEIADLNNDKLNDVIISIYGYNAGLYVYYQLPTGGFSAPTQLTQQNLASWIKVGDLNNDGLMDVLFRTASNYGILYQTTLQKFILKDISLGVNYDYMEAGLADMNNDQLLDIVIANGTYFDIVYQEKGKGIETTEIKRHNIKTPTVGINSFTINDINNDGRKDIICSIGGNRGSSYVDIFYQNSDFSFDTNNAKFIPCYDIPSPIHISDLNCDGSLEIIVGHDGWGSISVFDKNNSSEYQSYKLIPSSYYFSKYSMSIGDINNDNKPDIITSYNNYSFNIHYNKSVPLVFDSIEQKLAFHTKKDTTIERKYAYADIIDSSKCRHYWQNTHELNIKYENIKDTIDTIFIRYSKLCYSDYVDTLIHKTDKLTRNIIQIDTLSTRLSNNDVLSTPRTVYYTSYTNNIVKVPVNSNICWSLNFNSDWIIPDRINGKGKDTITFEIVENKTTLSKYATLQLKSDSLTSYSFSFYQQGIPVVFIVSKDSIFLNSSIDNKSSFIINSNLNWIISTSADWLSFTKTYGSNNDTIGIVASPNKTGITRFTTINIIGNSYLSKNIIARQIAENTALNNTSESLIKIYPNPVQNLLFIKLLDNTPTTSSIKIISVDGKVVNQKLMEKKETTIDMSKFSKGIYFIHIIQNNKTTVEKIVKE